MNEMLGDALAQGTREFGLLATKLVLASLVACLTRRYPGAQIEIRRR